ncbi:MAG: enoyl-CoA hydratase/isomerase family protein [Beutenbergiaceae bacterium]
MSSADTGTVSCTVDEQGVAHLLLDRPDKLNALTLAMVADLEGCIRELDSTTRALVLRSAGEKVFSVGADLNQVRALSAVEMAREWLAVGHRAFNLLAQAPYPTIAVIDGIALGGGLELALACDLRVMTDGAQVGLPETGIGAIPGWGGVTRLTQLVNAGRAADLILTRRRLTADEALDWGIVSRVVARAELEPCIDDIVQALLTGSPVAQQVAKSVIAAAAAGVPAHLVEPWAGGVAQASNDLREGTDAFFNKRPPRFTNS